MVYCGYATHPEVLDLVRGFAAAAGGDPGLRLRVVGGSERPATCWTGSGAWPRTSAWTAASN